LGDSGRPSFNLLQNFGAGDVQFSIIVRCARAFRSGCSEISFDASFGRQWLGCLQPEAESSRRKNGARGESADGQRQKTAGEEQPFSRCIGKSKFMFSSTISAGIGFSRSFVSDPPSVFPTHSGPAPPSRAQARSGANCSPANGRALPHGFPGLPRQRPYVMECKRCGLVSDSWDTDDERSQFCGTCLL
jgi:hypothetical protein